MRKRGIKPRGQVKIKWSPNFAYAIGLIATDGNLSPDGLHLNFTSKDLELAFLYQDCLGIKHKIGKKARGGGGEKKYYVVQFGDVLFYRFLNKIGLFPAKSKTIGELSIPKKYFFDFLRGAFDGDGTIYSYWDPRWRSSFMFYVEFISASKKYIDWLRFNLKDSLGIWGHITKSSTVYQLKYAKKESVKVLRKMYYRPAVPCLSRKRLKSEKILSIVGLGL